MALYDDELVRVSVLWKPVGGDFWTGEEAVTTWWLRHHHRTGNTWTWSTELASLPDKIREKFVAHWTDALARVHSNQGQIVQIKCAHIDTTGHDVDVAAQDITDGSLTGQQTGGMLPPEVALCISSWSYTPGGFTTHKGRKRGRFYLPYVAKAMCGDDGRVTDINAGNIRTDWTAFFNDVQGMQGDEGFNPPNTDPDFWDFVTVSGIDGTWHNTDHVSTDNKFDSQRRRQHQVAGSRFIGDISH